MDGRPRTVRTLVYDYQQKHANEHNLKPNTVAEYTRQLQAFVESCGDVELWRFTEQHVRDFLGACSPGSLPSRYSVIAHLLRWADRKGFEGFSELVPQRKPERRWRTRHLNAKEVARVWKWIDDREAKPRARPVTLDAIRLGIVVPLRRGEIASLAPHEVDLDAARLFLHDTKSGNRVVPLPPMGVTILRRRLMGATDYVFPARGRQGHMMAESLSHAWCRVARACGLDGVPFHCWRHTWASEALKRGVPLEYVRRILGHTTEWMSVKYAHVECSELQRAIDVVEASLIGGAA